MSSLHTSTGHPATGRSSSRWFGLSLMALVLAWCAGCASLPPRQPAAPTSAFEDVAQTRLARVAAAAGPDPALSGFRLMPEGGTAFNARIALARRAEKSIDAQYYLIQNDVAGQQFLRELRDAAMRGVRVRLLVDDLYAAGEDELFGGLAAFPNVEVRVFNPLPSRAGSFTRRIVMSLHQFSRINHRMHNKLFVADNSFAVAGGRNIADEYFMRGGTANFIDLDVLASGPVVRELSTAFDRYWNSEQVYPIERITTTPAAPDAARRRFDALVRDAGPVVPERERDVLDNPPVARQLDEGVTRQVFSKARVVVDPPDKLDGLNAERLAHTVTEQTLALFSTARDSVEIVSPYFIPGDRGLAMMRAGIARGGVVRLVTNSFGATDEPLVHAGYARYRLQMLQAGVRIHEVSPSLSSRSGQLGDFGRSSGRLHAKVAVIDRQTMFIGSMNLDPRSALANTEIGLVIESRDLIEKYAVPLYGNLLTAGAFELRLAPGSDQILWIERDAAGREIAHDREPDDDWRLRLKLWLLAPFVGEELL